MNRLLIAANFFVAGFNLAWGWVLSMTQWGSPVLSLLTGALCFVIGVRMVFE